MLQKPTDILLTTYQAGLILAKAHRSLKIFLDNFLLAYDLKTPEWALLGAVKDNGVLSHRRIAELLDVEAPLVTRMIKNMASKDLLISLVDQEDGRIKQVSITPAGIKLVTQVESKLRVEMRRFLNDVSVRELITYLKVLKKIANKSGKVT